MSLQTAIYSELSNVTAVTDLVGSTAIYAGRAPQSAGTTYIVYRKISNSHIRHQRGGSGLAQARVQVDCVAGDTSTMDSIYDQVRRALDNFQGTLGVDGSGDEVAVDSCMLENDRDDLSPPEDASQEGPCRVSMDFMITYSESAVDNIS